MYMESSFRRRTLGIEADGRKANCLAFRTRRAREEAFAIDRREPRAPGDEDPHTLRHEKDPISRWGLFP